MKFNQPIVRNIAVALLGFAFVYFLYDQFFQSKPQGPAPLPVIVQKPKVIKMGDYVTQTGNTVAYQSVDLVARIEGYLDSIEFTDGAFVKKGQELFVVEPEPYLEQLLSAEATLKSQKATYAYNKSEYERQKNMYKQNATSLNSVEMWKSKVEESQANIESAEASVMTAKINYGYTHVSAPFDGRMGRHLVDVGNLVGNGAATTIANIEQINPIYVYFNLNEIDLIKLRAMAKKRHLKPMDVAPIPIEVGLQTETGYPHKGELNFVDSGLNASTGTMEFRGILKNDGYPLVPGLFVQVRVPLSEPYPQLTIPDEAVLYDQIGAYVLVVNAKDVVEVRRVVIGGIENGSRAITKGVGANDRVIVSGLQNATPDQTVSPKESSL
ncbi:efflux RND transporter periplasmic adaptor subunit [Legionella waltersii]|uniref:RND multidrug efflux membrane fusion protein n=1 Tax=Legionella waltersii TaxID=66969 RepID=A0A0W1ABS1_9GAMM|nr:RND multidrug efflux membrane fusion protein [Legionella waltersii]SNV11259.1 RND multidrug efflux membrane fusion protein [Legionella waltersii]